MRSTPSVLAVLALAIGCSSIHRTDAAPAASLARATTPATAGAGAGEWSDALLPTEPVAQAGGAGAEASDESRWTRHVTVFIGRRKYSDGNLDQDFPGGSNLDMQHSGFKGLEVDGCNEATGNGYEVGISFAYQTDDTGVNSFDYELTTEEFYGGYRHTFRTEDRENIWHPFVGAGLSIIRAHGDSPGFPPYDDDASALCEYVHAGMTWEVGWRVRLGLDARQLFGTNDVDFGTPAGTTSADVNYQQVAFTIGYLL